MRPTQPSDGCTSPSTVYTPATANRGTKFSALCYGIKPKSGTPGILPFNSQRW
jgi:hypothetical protein